jgi:hypothetical protein
MTSSARRAAAIALLLVFAAAIGACGGRAGGPLGSEYEYEEDLTLRLDGTGTLVVNASIPALVALRGLPLPLDLRARVDQVREQVRQIYTSDQTHVRRISSWTRHGRRFLGIHVALDNVRTLNRVAPFSWATYELHEQGEQLVFRQTLSRPARAENAAMPEGSELSGNEIVAFRLHLPARIRFQNSRYLDRDESRPTARGNILTWEQRLADRLHGEPIANAEDKKPDVMVVRMDRQSILYRTLWLFAIAFTAALFALAGVIWLTMRRGTPEPTATTGPAGPGSSSLPR